MATPTLTRLGALRVQAHGYYDTGEQAASTLIHTIDGLRIRVDENGTDTPLYSGMAYRIARNDGWAVDPTTPPIHHTTAHWAHLIDQHGQPATAIPLEDGSVTLDQARAYVIREEHGTWTLYQE